MYDKSRLLACLALVMISVGVVCAVPLAPNDASISGNLALWLRNPETNYDPDAGIWTDHSGKGNDARADVDGFVAPPVSFGENPTVFSRPFSAVHCGPTEAELLRATNLNGGAGLTELTIFSVVKLVERGGTDQRPVGFGAYTAGDRADNFNMSFDVTVRKNNGFISGKNQDHPIGEFVIYIARMDPSIINMWFNSTGTLSLAFTAAGSSYTTSNDDFYVGECRYSPGGDFDISEVIVFNTALTDAQVEGISEWLQINIGSGGGNPLASRPEPADGALYENTWANLGWRAGYYAVSHDLYFGASFDDVNDGVEGTFVGNLATTTQVIGFPGFPASEGLQPSTTYYWRVDEVNDADPNSPWKGDVWSFWIPPRKAYDPSPADGVGFSLTDTTVSWTIGFNGKLSQMYFGTDAAEVEAGTGDTAKGPVVGTTYDPGPLEAGTTYYWRVDQFDGVETHAGDVWSLTTVPVIPVSDPDLKAWWTLEEGEGAVVVDQSGHGNQGSFVGDLQWVDGYQGTALEFAGGSAASPTYVNFGNAESLQLTGSITISAWVKMNAGNAGAYMGIGGKLVSGTYKGYALVRHNSNVFRLWCDDGAGVLAGHEASSNVPYTDTEWHHVVGVVDGLISSLYVDGVKQAQQGSVNLTESGVYAYVGKQYGDNSSHRYWNGLIDDVRIYSKALTDDEVADVMRGNKKLAGSPSPSGYSIVDIRDISSLSWSKGDTAASHDVYFGTDRDTMELQGNQTATSLSLADLVEFGGGDYYWRIDEVESDGTTTTGTIWKFTVPDYLIVDDFESYNDIEEGEPGSNRVFMTWIDGYGTTTNGAVAGNIDVPFMSAGRESGQAMPVYYDNAGKVSEATRTLTSKKDWTVEGVTKLVIWFSGAAGNAADRMFVALGNAVVYHPDDAATQDGGWNEWVIDLQEFASQGVDLTNVGSITLGIGTRGTPVATGGTGTVHFDDIRLIR